MRVTQSMLSNNMLRNLSTSYSKMGKLQDQITTGKKVNRPSDDPVVAMKGIGYRRQLDKVEQFQRNLGEVHNWLDSSDSALDQVGQALHRANELAVQASNGTLSNEDRLAIKSELEQLQKHIQDISNSKVGDKYIFSGTKTETPLYDETAGYTTDPAFDNDINLEVFNGIMLNVNTIGVDLFKNIDTVFDNFKSDIDSNSSNLSMYVDEIDSQMNELLIKRSDIGARKNRAELMDNRLEIQEVSSTKLMSQNEDIDYEKVITEMITQESIQRAALSVGARIIQPTLVDFLR